jgi:hypothetical protein
MVRAPDATETSIFEWNQNILQGFIKTAFYRTDHFLAWVLFQSMVQAVSGCPELSRRANL